MTRDAARCARWIGASVLVLQVATIPAAAQRQALVARVFSMELNGQTIAVFRGRPEQPGKWMVPPPSRVIAAASEEVLNNQQESGSDAVAVALEHKTVWEIGAGICAGGAFLAGYAAATASAPVAATGVGSVATGGAVISAAAVGCGLGLAAAVISFTAANSVHYLQELSY